MSRLTRALLKTLTLALALTGCGDDDVGFARVLQIEAMSQTIGGPAAAARPGDYLLENDHLRAAIHGRHNMRSTFPISNGSLTDLDIQRPRHAYGVGGGKDAFYELGPMVNLKVNNSATMTYGLCAMSGDKPSVGAAPCPCERTSDSCRPLSGCARVSGVGRGENIMGILGLLDLAIVRAYDASKLEIVNDYDVCPGEAFVRVATTARFGGQGTPVDMDELKQRTGLMDVLLGENTGKACETAADCELGEACDKLLIEINFGTLSTKMRRCRKPNQKLAGVLAGDFMLFSGKVRIFIPMSGFDHESYIRSVFDAGGDIFGAPLTRSFVAAVADDVSYAYFNADGEAMIPVFSEAFTASMTNRFACAQQNPDCIKGKELRFRRYVSVGRGDVASALAPYYKVRRIATGQVEGHVVEPRTQKPVSKVDVFVFGVPHGFEALTDEQIFRRSYDDLVAAHRKDTATTDNPDGEIGLVSHFRTDTGLDQVADGSFAGPLPPGRYILVARVAERAPSPLSPLRVETGRTARITLTIGDTAILQYQVQDQAGRPIPCKLTIGHCFPECARDQDCPAARPVCEPKSQLCLPKGGYTGADSCRPDQVWGHDPRLNMETCRCPGTGLLPLALGGTRLADNTVRVELSTSGMGEVSLEPGPAAYQVIVSRGFEYEISRQFVWPRPAAPAHLRAALVRSVDTHGWIAADFHVHGPNSVDSGLDHDTRIRSHAAEGVELVSASDHDYLTDYGPTIARLNLKQWLKSQIGLEVSPLDYGHFIGFPLRFNQNEELNGAFHWRVNKPDNKPPMEDWDNLTPGEIFAKLRELGTLGVDKTVVFIAHFYDHFTFFSVDPWTLEMPLLGVSTFYNKTLGSRNFSPDFDALEAFNGKNFDIIRRPTYKEIVDYNVTVAKFLASSKNLGYDERQKEWGIISAAAQRSFLHRTADEQRAGMSFNNSAFACRCTSDEECGQSSLCDEATANCIAACSADTSCDAALVAASRETCLPKPTGTDASRRTCQRIHATCANDAACTYVWKNGTKELKEKCLARDAGKPADLSCELACASDNDCAADPLRPVCGARKLCEAQAIVAAGPLDPCPTVRGTIDDWFQLLNHGVRRTLLGNSDSHGTYGTEAGIPRNYVRSEADRPEAIQSEAIAAEVKAMHTFPTYGPFVEVTLNDQPFGSTVKINAGDEVSLKIRVQSPLWFDIDRIEVYRNGEQFHVVEGKVDCNPSSGTCIKVPNDQVVKYRAAIVDKPKVDSWYVVVVMGIDGKTMAPVYSSTPVARLGMYELIQRLTPLLPPLKAFRTPLSPSMAVVRPYAVTNPIFADVGGDGFTSLLPPPSWAPAPGSTSSPLRPAPATSTAHTHAGHDHRIGLGKMRADAEAELRQMLGQKKISAATIQQALDSLRYTSFHR